MASADAARSTPANVPIRKGLPLPALVAGDLISQLVFRAVGPSPYQQTRRRALLLWAGLEGPTATVLEIARRLHVSDTTVSNWIRSAIAAGSAVPLTGDQFEQLTRPTLPGEDHIGRVRGARLFDVPRPCRLSDLTNRHWRQWSKQADRVIAALGPLSLRQLHAGLARAHRYWHGTEIPIDELAVGLLAVGDLTLEARGVRWAQRIPCPPEASDARLVAVLSQLPEVVSWKDMQTALPRAGHSTTSRAVLDRSPLLVQVARGRWALVSHYETS